MSKVWFFVWEPELKSGDLDISAIHTLLKRYIRIRSKLDVKGGNEGFQINSQTNEQT